MPSTPQQFMARALQLAQRGLYTTAPNPRVGCVLVRDDNIIAEGWHQHAGGPHAEIAALANIDHARGATAYITLEPCSHHGKTGPCAEALIDAGISHVVCAMQDPNPQVAGQGIARLQAAGITVETGVMQAEAGQLNPGFIQRMQTNRPFVRLKMAASLDGRTALANGQSQWITSAAARTDVQHWRARSCAILTGVQTVLADDPQLNQRLPDVARQPLRVILDSQLRTPPTAKLFQSRGRVVILTTVEAPQRAQLLMNNDAEVVVLGKDKQGKVSLSAVMAWLANQQINEIHVEAGATLAGALLQQQWVDELLLYLAPSLLGDTARGLFALPALTAMADKIQLDIQQVRQIGDDLRIMARIKE